MSAIEEPKWERPKWSSGKSYGGKLSKEPDLDADEDFGSYVDELFGLDNSDDGSDWQTHDDSEMCQFEFVYDDENQFERHKELCDDDDAKVEAARNVRGFHTLEFLIFKDGKPRTIKK